MIIIRPLWRKLSAKVMQSQPLPWLKERLCGTYLIMVYTTRKKQTSWGWFLTVKQSSMESPSVTLSWLVRTSLTHWWESFLVSERKLWLWYVMLKGCFIICSIQSMELSEVSLVGAWRFGNRTPGISNGSSPLWCCLIPWLCQLRP